MKKFLIPVLIILVSAAISSAQTFHWAHSLGLSNRSRALAIANDSVGNIYTLGVDKSFTQSITGKFQTGNLLFEKRTPNGELQWAKHFPGHACGLDIAVLSNGSILITGAFYDSLYFGAGDTLRSPDYIDRMFLASFSPEGALNWEKGDTSQWGAIGISITATDSSQFFVCGIVEDIEGMLCKYDKDGELLWQKRFPGVRNIDNLVYDAKGNLYICGTCTAQANFDGIALPPDTAAAQYITYVAKLDADGKTVWLHANTYSTFDISTTLAFDNLGYLCRIRSSKDFQHSVFEVIEPTVDSVIASWQFTVSTGDFYHLVTNSLTSTGSDRALFGPYYVSSLIDTTVIYQLRHGITSQGILFFMDTLAVVHGRGLRPEALSLIGNTLYLSGYFTDSVLHLGPVALENTNDHTKYQTDAFIASLTIDDEASVSLPHKTITGLKLYPNPSYENLTLIFDSPQARVIDIYNELGTLAKQVTSYANTYDISLQTLPAGLYTIIVHDNLGKVSTASFIHKH